MEQPVIETKKISMGRNAMNYSIVIGVVLVIFSIILFILNIEYTNFFFWLIKYVILITGIIIGTLYYRNKINGGFISYGKSLGSGVLISFFSLIILSIYLFCYYKFIDLNAIERILAQKETQILQYYPNLSDDKLDEIMTKQREWTTPLTMCISEIVLNTVLGFVASLIISFFTRKADKSFDANFR